MSKGVKGQFEFDKAKRAFMKKHGSELSYDNVAPELLEEMKKLREVYDRRIEKHTILDKIKTAVTKKAVTIDKQDLIGKLTELRDTPEGQKIAGVIDTYISHVDKIKGDKIVSDVDIVGVSGLYSGLTKIFETIYTFLSSPAALLHCAIRKFDKNSKWKFDNRDCEKFDKILAQNSPNYKKELTELGQIFDIQDEHVVFKQIRKVANIIKDKINHICTDVFHAKKGIFETEKTNAQIVELIKNRTRNVEIGAETGDLANISRTMVTIISTIFFVNDYRNRVLIESGGKDVKGANDEVKERIAHKASNFIINGTLMNTFNNVFKTPLNKSLFNAAVIAGCTETTNEFLVRKSICQPVGKKHSKDEIIQYELEQLNKGGFMGWWARTFKNITGKKSLTQKAGINIKETSAKQDK
ncbi:MAG: hypothetical protein IJW73_05250 [Candidatus Gastranaerophilales bacterium]|nr:hypothetical protein [Candidatus Gastranaerophilales bacterium]